MLSKVRFGSYLIYSPRGTSDISERSRKIVRDGVKHNIGNVIKRAIEKMVEDLDKTNLSSFFGPDVILVPVPRHVPRKDKDSLWVPLVICETLKEASLCKDLSPCLIRKTSVSKASFSGPGERTTVSEHIDSMKVETSLFTPRKITLVDDFITKGSTLLACASLISKNFTDAKINAFALVRTKGFVPEIEHLIEPCVGEITLSGDQGKREDDLS